MSFDLTMRPNPLLSTQARNPVRMIDFSPHHPYTAKREKAKDVPGAFQDFIREKMNRAYRPRPNPRDQYQQYQQYFKSKQISSLLSYPETSFDSPINRTVNGVPPNEMADEPSLDLSRFKMQIPTCTREAHQSRKAKSVGRQPVALNQSGLSPEANNEEKELDDDYTLETDTDLPERRTSILSDRELDFSRNMKSDSKKKIVFSEVPKLYANLRALHKTYAQNTLAPSENDESGILTDNFKSVGNTTLALETPQIKLTPIAETLPIQRSKSTTQDKDANTAKSNRGNSSERGEKKVELTDKIRNLIYNGSTEQDLQIEISQEEHEQICDNLRNRMKKFSTPKKRNRSADQSVGSLTPIHGVKAENRSNSSAKILGSDETGSKSPEKGRNRERHFLGLPNWLGKRKDFEDQFAKYAEGKSKRILTICTKPSNLRTPEEVSTVVDWLHNVKFFSSLPLSLFKNLAEKVRYRQYKKDENLCAEGDVGDCLYIIYEGWVKCFVGGNEVTKFVKFDTPGQSALHGARLRTATLTAAVQTDVLRLEVKDYLTIMKNSVAQEKEELSIFLRSIKIFSRFNDDQFGKLIDRIQTKQYKKGENIYEEGENAESFYILRQGLLRVETILTIEKQNVWPIESRRWIKSKLERKVKFGSALRPKDYFGEVELLKNCRRLNTVVCDANSQLLILNKTDFFSTLGTKELNDLLNSSKNNNIEDPDEMKAKLMKEEEKKKEMKDVINSSWGFQLRGLNKLELMRRHKKVVQPIRERFEGDFRNFVRENTYKTRKIELFSDANYD